MKPFCSICKTTDPVVCHIPKDGCELEDDKLIPTCQENEETEPCYWFALDADGAPYFLVSDNDTVGFMFKCYREKDFDYDGTYKLVCSECHFKLLESEEEYE